MTYEMIDMKKAVRRSLDVKRFKMAIYILAAVSVLGAVLGCIITGEPVGLLALLLPCGPFIVVFAVLLGRMTSSKDDYCICRGYLNDRKVMPSRNGRSVRFTAEFTTPYGESISKKTRWLWRERGLTGWNNYEDYENEPILFAYDAGRKRLLVLGTEREVLKAAEEDAAKETI